PFPERFDAQGTMDWTAALSAPTSIDFIDRQWGWTRAREYMTSLADYAESLVSEAFAAYTGEDHTVDVGMPVEAIRLVRLPGHDPFEIDAGAQLQSELLAEHGFAVQLTSFEGTGYWRLSTHVYNTAADYEEFAERAVPIIVDRLRARRH
ncbi:MAG: aminotransferase class V-fold PLP-dependent enzyme, partial [Humibacter sp.]